MRIRKAQPETSRGGQPSPFSLSATRPFAVQRYTVIAPDHIDLEKGAQVTTQDIEQTRYGSTYRESTHTAKAKGKNPATTRVDTAINAGTLTSQDSTLPSFRVSESAELAVPDEGQPRNFYAESTTVQQANQSFRESGALTRLMIGGHGVNVPTDPKDPEASETRNLKKVHAAEEVPTGVGNGVRLQLATALPEMNCDVFISLVMGAANNASRAAVLQETGKDGETEIPAPTGNEPLEPMARHMTRKKSIGPEKMKNSLRDKQLQPQDLVEGKTAYEQMEDSKRQARSARLGINESALPEVGEGFVIRSMDTEELRGHPVPAAPQGPLNPKQRKRMRKGYLEALNLLKQAEDNLQADRRALPARIQRMMRTWGEHYAGVVAKDGPDVVTFENYNRRTEMRWEHERIFNNLFRDFEQFRLHVSQQVTSLYQAPDEATIRNLVQTARAGQDLEQEYQNALDEALASFTTGLQQSQRTTVGNFFFQMYGPGEQSFHSAYKGVASNAMTLRVRETDQPVLDEAKGTLNGLRDFVNLLNTGVAAQAVNGITPTLQTRVQQGQADYKRLKRRLDKATTRGQYTRIDDEITQTKGQLRTAFRNDLIQAYTTITGEQLAQPPADLQGLITVVGNYLTTHPGTGIFRGLYASVSGWRQRLLDFQTLLGSFDANLHL